MLYASLVVCFPSSFVVTSHPSVQLVDVHMRVNSHLCAITLLSLQCIFTHYFAKKKKLPLMRSKENKQDSVDIPVFYLKHK